MQQGLRLLTAWILQQFIFIIIFFFNLEKKVADRKTLSHLKLPEGGETTDEHKIFVHALHFYENLYRAEPCDGEITETLLQDLPHLTESDNE